MTITYETGNVLDAVTDDVLILVGISRDMDMRSGLPKLFDERFDLKRKLTERYLTPMREDFVPSWMSYRVDNVVALPIKDLSSERGNRTAICRVFEDFAEQCKVNKTKKVIMPKIGAGHNRISWEFTEDVIRQNFDGMDIEFVVYELAVERPEPPRAVDPEIVGAPRTARFEDDLF